MIGKVSEGLGISARKLNEIIDGVNRLLGLSVQPPLQLANSNGSFQLRVSGSMGGVSGGGSTVYVRTTEVATATEWTAGALLSGPLLTNASPAETVEVQTCWGIMRSGVPCPATDTGTLNPTTGLRRFRLNTLVLAADVAVAVCQPDGTLATVTRRIPGAAGPEG